MRPPNAIHTEGDKNRKGAVLIEVLKRVVFLNFMAFVVFCEFVLTPRPARPEARPRSVGDETVAAVLGARNS